MAFCLLILALVTVSCTAGTPGGQAVDPTSGSAVAATPTPTPVVNTLSSGAPVQRLDTAGMPIDVHDGQLSQFDGRYYWYGSSYGCGFQWNNGTFCGFSVYQSDDLVSWDPGVPVVDATAGDWPQACALGCFRPHVQFIAGQYVMWINVNRTEADAVGGRIPGTFRVLTAPTPAGPFTYRPGHGTTDVPWGGDANVLDTAAGAYLVATDRSGRQATDSTHEIVIQKLADDGLDAVGPTLRLPGVGFVEAPTLWQHAGQTYLAIGDPACPYCQGSGVTVFQTDDTDLLSGWSAGYRVSEDACGGQLTQVTEMVVDGAPVTLLQTDRWVALPGQSPTLNQGLSSQAWVPVTYTDDGRVAPVDCDAVLTVASSAPAVPEVGTAGDGHPPLVVDGGGRLTSGVQPGDAAPFRVWAARALDGTGTGSVELMAGDAVVTSTPIDIGSLPWALSPITVDPGGRTDVTAIRITRDAGGGGLFVLGQHPDDPASFAVARG